ncbi:hypothetical protein ACFPN0_15015 [Kitasatospora cinereorecta]
MTDSAESAPIRDTAAVLADMDALLAEVDKGPQAPAPAEPEAAVVPEDDMAVEWEKVTAPRPPRQRTKQIPRHNTRYGYGTDAVTLDKRAEPDAPAEEPVEAEDEPAHDEDGQPAPAATAPVSTTKVSKTKTPNTADAQDDDEEEGDGDDAPQPSRRHVVVTTLREWRPPAGPRGKAWGRAVAFTGSGALLGFVTGVTRNVYETFDSVSINADAVAGVVLAAALAALMISRSKKTFIGLGAAFGLVLFLQYVTLPVAAGGLATVIVWALDQRARTMRPVIAWAVRAAFATVALAAFALVWTSVVHFLTGAAQ